MTPTPKSPSETIKTNPGLQIFVDTAQDDLSKRLSIPVSEIELIEILECAPMTILAFGWAFNFDLLDFRKL